MPNTIVTYKAEAAGATASAIVLGTTTTPETSQISILQWHLVDNFFGFYVTLGDFAALVGATGVLIVMISSSIKYIKGKFGG